MRIKNILLLTGTLFSTLFHSQMNLNGVQTQQLLPFPASAESYSLSKIEKMPMDYFRGKANINIPIYTITMDGVSIPISLSYNTGGIKLNEVAGTVGLGWSLNIPGSINQNIIGLNDTSSTFFSKNINDYGVYNGYFNALSQNNAMRANLYALYNNNYDTKKDIFDYNLPTVSGSFILKDNTTAYMIPYEDVFITKTNNKFYAKDNTGTEYWLSAKNLTISDYVGQTLQGLTNSTIDSLKINNKSIRFSYQKLNGYTERNINEKANFKISPNLGGNYETMLPLPKYEKTESNTTSVDHVINKIDFDGGNLTFLYSDDAGCAFSDGSLYRKDLSNAQGIVLRRIIVKNKAGQTIRDIKLNYSYFESINTNKNYEDYRLKLVNIYDQLENNYYKFEYNEDFNLPKRNSSNDDYWGYINNVNNGEGSNIPFNFNDENEIPSNELLAVQRRDREPNQIYAILGSLKSITYPTGGKKNFYYELPYVSEKKVIAYGTGGIPVASMNQDESAKSFQVTYAHIQQIMNLGIQAAPYKLQVDFGNSCDNGNNQGGQEEIDPDGTSSCTGSVSYGEQHFSQWQPYSVDWNYSLDMIGNMSLFQYGNCHCNIDATLIYKYPIYSNENKQYSGLRIHKIEDVDQNNISNVFEYKYGKYENGQFVPYANLKQPYNFSAITKRFVKHISEGSGDADGGDFEKYFTIHNSSQSMNSYGSSEIATYPYVIETNGKGSVIREFEDNIFSRYKYDKWKNGNIKKEIYLNAVNDTVKVIDNKNKLNLLKNSLSTFTVSYPGMVAFSVDFDIVEHIVTSFGTPVETYHVTNEIYSIESAKLENDTSEITDYLYGKKIITTTKYNYSDTDINKPINLQSTENILPSGEKIKTSYSYAHEKGNQFMIDKNMVGIPLETIVTQTVGSSAKTLSKSETLYPISQSEANIKTSGLVLPTSALSYDLQNIPSTDITYDKYDLKGNLQQYTTKDGVSTTIIWGYNQTQPIAKIEGAKLSDIQQSFIDSIVNASDTDASAVPNNDESALLSALDSFRNNSVLSGYQMTTYTYDPLIGVRSITPPSGIRELYKYDSANRLESIKDADGKLLKEFKYNYKN